MRRALPRLPQSVEGRSSGRTPVGHGSHDQKQNTVVASPMCRVSQSEEGRPTGPAICRRTSDRCPRGRSVAALRSVVSAVAPRPHDHHFSIISEGPSEALTLIVGAGRPLSIGPSLQIRRLRPLQCRGHGGERPATWEGQSRPTGGNGKLTGLGIIATAAGLSRRQAYGKAYAPGPQDQESWEHLVFLSPRTVAGRFRKPVLPLRRRSDRPPRPRRVLDSSVCRTDARWRPWLRDIPAARSVATGLTRA